MNSREKGITIARSAANVTTRLNIRERRLDSCIRTRHGVNGGSFKNGVVSSWAIGPSEYV